MESFLSSWGYLALILLTVAEAACVPFPSEITVGFAGYLASIGRLDLVVVIVLGTVGETVGAFIGYGIGRLGGRPLVERFGRYVLLSHADLDRAERWFDHRGEWSVLIGRVVPIVRTFVALPAGVAQMQPARFGILTSTGSLLWIGSLAGISYSLGGQWQKLTHGFSVAGYVLVVLAVLAIAGFVLHRWRQVRTERATDTPGMSPPGEAGDALEGGRTEPTV